MTASSDSPGAPAGPVQLNGWKEIAAYLGRSVRTVQRWEKDFGLPVRRFGVSRPESVFAFPREIDAWLETAQGVNARSGAAASEPAAPQAEVATPPDPAPVPTPRPFYDTRELVRVGATVVAAAILDLIVELRRELGLSYMFISHDLKVVRAVCDDVIVLYAGRKVAAMPAEQEQSARHHPYTRLLFNSVPELKPGWLERTASEAALAGEGIAADVMRAPGCPFFPRCPVRLPGTCDQAMPAPRILDERTSIACFQSDDALPGS